jgi:hypothetical protein
VSVFDCSAHFLEAGEDCDFLAGEVLAQKNWKDPMHHGEVPDSAFVAVLHTTSVYQRGSDYDVTISLNINAVCILVAPVMF